MDYNINLTSTMRILSFLYLILVAIISSAQTKNNESVAIKSLAFQSIKHSNIGVILTDELIVYDRFGSQLKTIKNLYGEIVAIDSISKEKIDLKNTGDNCNLLNFVKIRSEKITGWVYSSKVYEHEINPSFKRDTTLVFNQMKIDILPAKNFNIGVYDEVEDMLTFCGGNDSPVIFYNSKYKKYETILLENLPESNNDYSENYFTLDNHDGWGDKIIATYFSSDRLTLVVKRGYQEGEATITIEIKFDKHKSIGKVIKYERRPF
jgi:hypothetical protein